MPRRKKRNSTKFFKMPFGRFAGQPLEELPESYLDWLNGLPDLREPLLSAVRRERRARFSQRRDDPSDRDQSRDTAKPRPILADLSAREAELLAELIETGFRAMAMRHHPDRGGSHEIMQRLNSLMKKLRGEVHHHAKFPKAV